MHTAPPFKLLVSVAALAGAGACTGNIGDRSPNGGGDGDVGKTAEALCKEHGPMPGPMPRLTRLTHTQYDNTVRDLFGKDLEPSSAFIEDPTFAGFSNNAAGLLVSDRLARDYRRAAEEVAEAVTADAAVMGQILPCAAASGDEVCALEFIQDFGKRVYRSPLAKEDEDAYMALYQKGNGAYPAGSAFEQGIHLVIEGMLQSPHFLYRVELSEKPNGENIIPLDGFELASRLSYLLWNSMPDAELITAAEAGELATSEGLAKQARRLLDDGRASGPIDDFHAQWLQMKKFENLSKDPGLYPTWDASLADDMKEETKRFIRHVVLEAEGDYAELLTSPTTYVNADLAGFYGLEGSFGADFQEVDLDPQQRAGFLTQIGFLASHAYTNKDSPIHRGVFIQRQVLCAKLPDPPGNVDTTLPPIEGEIKTTRQAVEVHTSPEACHGCHGLINPAGFTFENYDAVGAWRTDENGVPVDNKATVVVGDGTVEAAGAVDLIGQLASSPVAQKCYLTQWFRYGYARHETDTDQCTIDALDEVMKSSGYNVKELLVALTQTKTFRFRALEEVGK